MTEAQYEAAMIAMAQKMADEGQTMAAGWVVYRLACLARDMPQPLLDSHEEAAATKRYPPGCPDPDWCRGNGACYWDCKGDETTPDDARRMENIIDELNRFADRLRLKYGLCGWAGLTHA